MSSKNRRFDPFPPCAFPASFPPIPGPQGPRGPAGTFSPAYRNFWRVGPFQTIPSGGTLPFTNDSPTMAGGITRTGNTITIPLAGDYFISYVVTVFFTTFGVPTVGVFLGPPFNEVPNMQTRFALETGTVLPNNSLLGNCLQLSGQAIVTIPADSQLELRNIGNPFDLCGNGIEGVSDINSVALNIIKLSQ